MIPKNKQELIDEIKTHLEKIVNLAKNIDKNKIHQKNIIGHKKETFISAHNLISYLNGRAKLVIKRVELHENKKEIIFPEEGYKWNELGYLAEKFYKDFENYGYEDLIIDLEKNYEKILLIIDKKSQKELYQDLWYKKYTLGRMIQFNTSSPCKSNYLKLKKSSFC